MSDDKPGMTISMTGTYAENTDGPICEGLSEELRVVPAAQYRALAAERDALISGWDYTSKMHAGALDERDAAIRALSEEGRKRGAAEAERDALRAEVDMLRLDLKAARTAATQFCTERDALRAEVEAARAEGWRAGAEAMREDAGMLATDMSDDWWDTPNGDDYTATDMDVLAHRIRALPIPTSPKGETT